MMNSSCRQNAGVWWGQIAGHYSYPTLFRYSNADCTLVERMLYDMEQ